MPHDLMYVRDRRPSKGKEIGNKYKHSQKSSIKIY